MGRAAAFKADRDVLEALTFQMNDAEAAKKLGVSMVTFYNARKKLGVKSYFEKTGNRLKNNGEIYQFKNYNERYFESIDSPDKAYFLGLLASDGNISPRLTAVRIALKEDDQDILEKFREYLGKDAPKLKLKHSKNRGVYSSPQKILCLSRVNMVQDLILHGITPNKSKTLKIECNFQGFEKDFLRGVWDGDGSIGVRRFKVCTASADFSVQLQEMIEKISNIKLPIKTDISKSGNPLYVITGYIKDAPAIQAIYEEAELGLQRKLKAYKVHWESRR
jgi:hypothetical protein